MYDRSTYQSRASWPYEPESHNVGEEPVLIFLAMRSQDRSSAAYRHKCCVRLFTAAYGVTDN